MPNNTPKRPARTEELVLEAIEGKCIGMPFTAEQFAEQYSNWKDSYEIARDLDKYHHCDLTRDALDLIDDMIGLVDKHHHLAVKKWFVDNDIKPPYPVGTQLTKGLITGICNHSTAYYLVKEPGCTNPNRSLLVRFEDAVLAACEVSA